MADERDRLADGLLSAVEAHDIAAMRQVYAPDAKIWHSHDGLTQTVDESLAVVAAFMRRAEGTRYVDRRRHLIEDGFVLQHRMTTRFDGAPVAVDVCIVCEVKDGRISRLEEYFHGGALAAAAQG
jgi:ketosteroid isomerase-like protein